MWQAQSLTHLCKRKPSRDQGVNISPKVNKFSSISSAENYYFYWQVEQFYTTVKKIKLKLVIWKERNIQLSRRKTYLEDDIVIFCPEDDNFYADLIFSILRKNCM